MLHRYISLVILARTASAGTSMQNNTSIVQTTHGPIIGFIDPTTSIQIFKNIPYGADTSTTRFKPPKPPSPWEVPKLCHEYGPTAPQPWGREIPSKVASEDCLNLNIWTPSLNSDDENRSVLVWFHGGGYEHLTSNEEAYDGTKLAKKRNVVVVTINHRVNGFGYLYLGGVDAEEYKIGNVGQLDLVLALEWVRDNIGQFGGDKENVLVFGQSGGGAKCATRECLDLLKRVFAQYLCFAIVMAMPAAKGLFHRVWTMSGQQITGRTRVHAEQTASEVLRNARGNTTREQLSNLLKLPMEDLRKAMRGGPGQKWTPLIDGITLLQNPFFPNANEQSKDVPMAIGNTYDETRSLIGGGNPGLFNLTWSEVPTALEKNVKNFIGNLTGQDITMAYRKQYPQYSPADVFFAASTAARSWKSMIVESDVRVKQANSPTWVYYLRWKSPFEGGKWGASHGFDISMVFANADAMKQTKGVKSAEALGDIVSKLLVNFAKTGDPNGGVAEFVQGKVPFWPRYDLESRESMIFDKKLEIHQDDRSWERKFFDRVEYVQPGT